MAVPSVSTKPPSVAEEVEEVEGAALVEAVVDTLAVEATLVGVDTPVVVGTIAVVVVVETTVSLLIVPGRWRATIDMP